MKKTKGNILKIILIIVAILLLAFLINYARKAIIICDLSNKYSVLQSMENFYGIFKYEDSTVTNTTEMYKMGDKNKRIITIENVKQTAISNGKLENIYFEKDGKKTARLNIPSSPSNMYYVPNYTVCAHPIIDALFLKVSNSTIDGQDCYLIETTSDKFTEGIKIQFYVDKELGSVIKSIETFDNGETITRYSTYKLNVVTDNDFIDPDINEYEIVK